MQIFNLNIFNNQNVNFKKAKTYKLLIKLPKTPCACCGGETITNSELKKFWANVSRPLSKQISEGKLDKYKDKWPEVWKELIVLALKFPKESLGKILNHKNMFDDVANFIQKIIDPENKNIQSGVNLLNSILKTTREELRSSSVIMREAEMFETSINEGNIDLDKDVFKQLKIYAQKFPRMRISKIIQLPEIHKHNSLMTRLMMDSAIEERDFHFANILKLIPKDEVENFKEIEKRIRKILSLKSKDEIKRNNIKNYYSNVEILKKDEKLREKIFKEIDGMQMSFKTKESFLAFSAFRKFNDNAIIGSILDKHVSTFEHVLPQSKNGPDSIYNGVIMCQNCNQTRGTISYPKFIRIFPEMPKNLFKQLEFVTKAIEKGKLPENYDNYPIKISSTISNITHGEVDFCDFAKQYAKKLKRKNNRVIKKSIAKMEEFSAEEKLLKEKLEEIKKQKIKLKEEAQRAKSKNQSIDARFKE
jgi:hypothetical protein